MRFLWMSLLCLSCGGSGGGEHILRVIADDGSVAGNPIIRNAVQEIEIIIVPDPANGGFEPMEPEEIMGGDAEVRVSAVGEWVLRLRNSYIEDNFEPAGSTFRVDVPIFTNQAEDPVIRDPTLRVNFIRNGERIAESNPRFLQWPPPEDAVTDVLVRCPERFRLQCLNNE
ncbi:MAG: hypothetical protein AAGE52_08510 [Myxococcota bacterium]